MKTLYDPAVEERAEMRRSVEIAKEMIKDEEPLEKIMRYTKLTPKIIEKIKKELNKELIHQ